MIILAGKYKGRKLKSPKGLATRPTTSIVKKALFDICAPYIEESRFLDLFGGSGAIGFEALSRGATHVTFCEQNPAALRSLHENAILLECTTQTTLYRGNAVKLLSKLNGPFDIIYIDPPYNTLSLTDLLTAIDSSPLLAPDAHLFIESPYSSANEWEGLALHKLILKDMRRFANTKLSQFISK